jgi:hypothetical protein
LGVIQESAMSEPIDLSAVPSRFLNPKEWAKLRAFAPNDLLALTYINAPYPDEENPGEFFWGRDGSIKDAIRCYNIARSLLQQCRTLLSEGKLVATGLTGAGRRQTISSGEAMLTIGPRRIRDKFSSKPFVPNRICNAALGRLVDHRSARD